MDAPRSLVPVDPRTVENQENPDLWTCPEAGLLDHRIKNLARSISCQTGGNLADLFVQNDICERCQVPLVSFTKESQLVCPACTRPRSNQSTVTSNSFDTETENTKHASDRKKNFKTFIMQFKEGTRIPDEVIARLNQEFTRSLHMYCHQDYKIGKIRDLLDALNLREWKPYSQRIIMQLLRLPMPSLTREEIEVMLEMYDFVQNLFLVDKSSESSFPNAKRMTEMIFTWLKMHSFAACFPASKTSLGKKPQYPVCERMCKLLETY
jgi:uncharacterized Zn finger protein (UPF0148 family)